jgi:hypothetical protein
VLIYNAGVLHEAMTGALADLTPTMLQVRTFQGSGFQGLSAAMAALRSDTKKSLSVVCHSLSLATLSRFRTRMPPMCLVQSMSRRSC